MRVLVPLAEGFEEIEAVALLDVLRRGDVEVVGAALGPDLAVRGSHGLILMADASWDALDLDAFDALALPGGGLGTENLAADPRVLEAVRAFDADERIVGALCAAPTILAAVGALSDRRATCYPSCADQLGAAYDAAPVIADGHVITGQGPSASLLFALVLLQHLAGDETARQVAASLLVEF